MAIVKSSLRKIMPLVLITVLLAKSLSLRSEGTKFDQKKLGFQMLDDQLESFDPQFIQNFKAYYSEQRISSLQTQLEQAKYLHLLAKIYLYNLQDKLFQSEQPQLLNQGRYLLAYFYFKIAAQTKSFAQSYYYLAVMQFFRLIPDSIIAKNIQLNIQKGQYQNTLSMSQIVKALRSSHLTAVEFSLFQSSLLDPESAVPQTVLANMNKQGIGMQKNCSAAAAYYLAMISKTFVDVYELRALFGVHNNFEKELYSHKKVQLENYGNQDISSIQDTTFFDNQIIKSNLEVAQNYFYGINGYRRDYEKAVHIYKKLSDQGNQDATAMLGLCYLKGHGVHRNPKTARKMFLKAQKFSSIADFMITAMDYFGLDGPAKKQQAIKKLLNKEKKRHASRFDLTALEKYLLGSIIVKGQVSTKSKDDGVVLLEQASLSGSSMASIIMGMLFLDGAQISYDCWRAVSYFSEQATQRVFFRDKYEVAKMMIKKGALQFALFKYLELIMVGHEDSFINALYLIQLYQDTILRMSPNSWSVDFAAKHQTYKITRRFNIVPDIYSFFVKDYQRQFSVVLFQHGTVNQRIITLSNLNRFLKLENSSGLQTLRLYSKYVRHKIITIGAKTKQNTLLKFLQFKDMLTGEKFKEKQLENQISANLKQAINVNMSVTALELLRSIANGKQSQQQLHVYQARYLLGKYYQLKDAQTFLKQKQDSLQSTDQEISQEQTQSQRQVKSRALIDPSKRAIQQYKLASNSQILARLIYVIQGGQIEFQFTNDLMSYSFAVILLILLLYIQRSRRLNFIYEEEMQRINVSQSQSGRPDGSNGQKKAQLAEKKTQKIMKQLQMKDQNQPIISQD